VHDVLITMYGTKTTNMSKDPNFLPFWLIKCGRHAFGIASSPQLGLISYSLVQWVIRILEFYKQEGLQIY
jgi:hypothetical protein